MTPPDPAPGDAVRPEALPPDARVGHGYLEGVGGVRLFFRAWELPRPRGRVLVVHGLGEHSGRFGRLAAALTGAGFSAYAADLRGHGRSRGRRGHVQGFEQLLRDLDRLRRRACARGDGPGADPAPAFVLGQSLGGLVALRYLQEFPLPSLLGGVAVAPFVRLAAPVPAWKLKLGSLADRLTPGLTMDNEMESDLLLRDPREREAYSSDPLVHGRISARLWGEMLRQAEVLRDRAPELEHRLLLQVPGEDRVVDPEAVATLGGRLGGDARVLRYPGAYHDLYHDPAGGEALADVVAWLTEGDRPVRPSGGGDAPRPGGSAPPAPGEGTSPAPPPG